MADTTITASHRGPSPHHRRRSPLAPLTAAGILGLVATLGMSGIAQAATPTVGLGTVGSYSVIAGSAVTNTGPSQLSGDVGVWPGTAISGFPPGLQAGARHQGDAVAQQAQSDLTTAYNDARGRAVTAAVPAELADTTLKAGVYKASEALHIDGTLTLDGENRTNSVFIFQVPSTLITASASQIALIRGASACNVFWQVGSSATLGTDSVFTGTLMALQSISVTTGTTVQGRALARNGAVTLDTNVFTNPECTSPQPTATVTSPGPTRTVTSPGPTRTVVSPGPTRTVVSPGPTRTVVSPGPTTTVTGPTTGPTSTVPGPTTTVPGPTATVPGPTTVITGPTRTVHGPTRIIRGPTTLITGPTTTVGVTQTQTVYAGAGGTATATAGGTGTAGTGGGTSSGTGGTLAKTGAGRLLWPVGGGAALLIVLGALLVLKGRPRSRHS